MCALGSRDELGPEAALADRLKEDTQTLLRLPRPDPATGREFPPKGVWPEAPPMPHVALITAGARRAAAWLGLLLPH